MSSFFRLSLTEDQYVGFERTSFLEKIVVLLGVDSRLEMDVGWKGSAWTLKEGDVVGSWSDVLVVSRSVGCCWF